jgi:hypothetical protein
MYSTLMVELNAWAAALSKADPTRPIDCATLSRRHAASNVCAVYCLGSTGRCNTGALVE